MNAYFIFVFVSVLKRLQTQPFRCNEQSGTSSLRKAGLVAMVPNCIKVVTAAGLAGSLLAFRPPVVTTAPVQQSDTYLPPTAVWLAWEELRDSLPDFPDSVIIGWLMETGSLSGETGRVLSKGLRRVMDLGALGVLLGAPCGDDGGVLWLKFR